MQTPQPSLTIKEIIEFVPFTKEFRAKLQEVYPDKLDTARRVQLERYLWRAFYLQYDLLYEENLQLMIEETENNLPEGYHDIILEKTRQQITQGIVSKRTNAEIENIRGDLTQLIHGA